MPKSEEFKTFNSIFVSVLAILFMPVSTLFFVHPGVRQEVKRGLTKLAKIVTSNDDVFGRIRSENVSFFLPETTEDLILLILMLFYAYTPALAVIIVLFIGAVPSAVALRQTETVNSDHLASSKFLKLAPIGAMFMAVLYHLTPAFARETFYPYKKSMFFWSVLMFGTGLKPERIQTETEAGKMAKCVVISLIRAAPVIVMSEMGRPLGLLIFFIASNLIPTVSRILAGLIIILATLLAFAFIVWMSSDRDRMKTILEEGKRRFGKIVSGLRGEEAEQEDREETQRAEVEEQTCAICLSESREFTFIPCGHRVLCEDCGEQLKAAGNMTCIICRAPATMIIKVYDT